MKNRLGSPAPKYDGMGLAESGLFGAPLLTPEPGIAHLNETVLPSC